MLNRLKRQLNKLVLDNNDKVKEIEKELGQDLPSYKNFNTEIDLNGLNESQSINLYKLKIEGLNSKLEHSGALLIAVKEKDEESIKALDVFREFGCKVVDSEV